MATVAAIVVGLVLVSGALFLTARARGFHVVSRTGSTWVLVVAPGSWGILRFTLRRTKAPERVEEGLAHLDTYVEKLTQSSSDCYLTISDADGQRGFSLVRRGGDTLAMFTLREPAREDSVRRLLGSFGTSSKQDYVSRAGTRCLIYPVPEGHGVAAFCRQCLQEVFQVNAGETLQFTFENHST